MKHNSCCLMGGAVVIFSLAFVAVPVAFAYTPPTVTVDANLTQPGDLVVTVTSHMEKISSTTVIVNSAGDLFTIDSSPIPVYLPLEVPVTVRIPVRLNPAGRYATAIVRITTPDFGAVQVAEFAFSSGQSRRSYGQ